MGFFSAGGASIETMFGHPAVGGEDATIQRRLTQMIKDTPVGAHIHAAIFRLDLDYVRDALIDANNRGSEVHVMHDGQDHGNDIAMVLSKDAPNGLGERHRWSGKPYDPTGRVRDYGAVATGPGSDLHTKLFLFTATKDPEGRLRSNVVWWASANLSVHSGTQKSNNAMAVYDDGTLYANCWAQLWNLIWNETHFPDNDFYSASRDRGTFMGNGATRFKAYCSPEQTTDLWVNRLDSVVAQPGSEVHVAQSRFHDSRAAVADQLVRIKKAGATVRVAVSGESGDLGPLIRRKLLSAGIPVRTASIHDKLVLVNSRYGLSVNPRKVVFNGSHNLTQDANYVNDDILVKLFHDEVYDDMLAAHFEPIWSTAAPVR